MRHEWVRGLHCAARLAVALAKVRVLHLRVPLFVEWNLTFRCNQRCLYCGACDAPRAEWDTQQVLEGLQCLWRIGARWITLGGGEPLLREDIGDIARGAHALGFRVYLSSNGALLPQKPDILQWIHHVNISLDGGPETHDAIRGKGTHAKAMAAITTCRDAGVSVSLLCVISSMNLDRLDEVLEIAARHGLTVMFQPATRWLDSSTAPNPIAPPVAAYRGAMEQLIARKRAGAPVRNSITGLKHLAQWPQPAYIWCSAARLTGTVEPDGMFLACHQAGTGHYLQTVGVGAKGADLAQQFRLSKTPSACRQCWCAPMVELALLFSLRPEPLWNALRTFL